MKTLLSNYFKIYFQYLIYLILYVILVPIFYFLVSYRTFNFSDGEKFFLYILPILLVSMINADMQKFLFRSSLSHMLPNFSNNQRNLVFFMGICISCCVSFVYGFEYNSANFIVLNYISYALIGLLIYLVTLQVFLKLLFAQSMGIFIFLIIILFATVTISDTDFCRNFNFYPKNYSLIMITATASANFYLFKKLSFTDMYKLSSTNDELINYDQNKKIRAISRKINYSDKASSNSKPIINLDRISDKIKVCNANSIKILIYDVIFLIYGGLSWLNLLTFGVFYLFISAVVYDNPLFGCWFLIILRNIDIATTRSITFPSAFWTNYNREQKFKLEIISEIILYLETIIVASAFFIIYFNLIKYKFILKASVYDDLIICYTATIVFAPFFVTVSKYFVNLIGAVLFGIPLLALITLEICIFIKFKYLAVPFVLIFHCFLLYYSDKYRYKTFDLCAC